MPCQSADVMKVIWVLLKLRDERSEQAPAIGEQERYSPRLAALLGDALVDALAKPDVRVHVPRVEQNLRESALASISGSLTQMTAHLEVRSELDRADADVARRVVMLRLRVVSEARDDKGRLAAGVERVWWAENERGLGERDSRDAPDGVVLRAGDEAGGVHQGEPGERKSARSCLNERAGTHFWTKVIPATALRSSNRSMPYFHPYVEKIAR